MTPNLRIAVFVAGMLLATGRVLGCVCTRPDVATAVRQADLVFRGKLIKVTYLDPKGSPIRRYRLVFEVSAVWKGVTARRIVLHDSEGASDCGGSLKNELGTDLLIFANRVVVRANGPDFFSIPQWTDKIAAGATIVFPGVCTLSSEIKNAKDTLAKLGRPITIGQASRLLTGGNAHPEAGPP